MIFEYYCILTNFSNEQAQALQRTRSCVSQHGSRTRLINRYEDNSLHSAH